MSSKLSRHASKPNFRNLVLHVLISLLSLRDVNIHKLHLRWHLDHVSDPNLFDGSTSWVSTSSSTKSKREPYAQYVCNQLPHCHLLYGGKWMRRFEWINPDAKLCLYPQYVIPLSWSSVLSRKWKYVSVRRRWLKLSMMAAFPCTFNAMYHQLDNHDALTVEVKTLPTNPGKTKT